MGKTTPPVLRLPNGKLAPAVPFKKSEQEPPGFGGNFWRALFGLAIFDPFNWRGDRPSRDNHDE
ncbi:MAG TPA: hypothetical protein DCW88_13250 [Agrobacterium sp.]|nr:hypothetical protein [Agrobacterium sp.]